MEKMRGRRPKEMDSVLRTKIMEQLGRGTTILKRA